LGKVCRAGGAARQRDRGEYAFMISLTKLAVSLLKLISLFRVQPIAGGRVKPWLAAVEQGNTEVLGEESVNTDST
jgi:hypothetical protein